VTILY